jgi:hypothetical protein
LKLSTAPASVAPKALALAALGLAQGDSFLLALGDKIAFALGVAQDSIARDLFSESLE